MTSSELDQLWLSFLDGELINEDHPRLIQWLEQNPEARRHLVSERQVDAMLQQLARADDDPEPFVEACVARFVAAEISPPMAAAAAPAAESNRSVETDPPAPKLAIQLQKRQPRVQSGQNVWRALLLAAAMLLPLACLVWVWQFMQPQTAPVTLKKEGAIDSSGPARPGLDEAFADWQQRVNRQPKTLTPAPSPPKPEIVAPPPGSTERIAKQRPTDEQNSPREQHAAREQLGAGEQRSAEPLQPGPDADKTVEVVSLTSHPSARWQLQPSPHSQHRRYVLASGAAQMTFAGGSTLDLQGPTDLELTSDTVVFVAYGNLLANIAPASDALVVRSPSVSLQPRPAAEFHLAVSQSGEAEVFVHDGLVQLQMEQQRHVDEPWVLNASELNQAVVAIPDHSTSPAICMARGSDETFRGAIDAGGKSMEFQSGDMFAGVLRQAQNAHARSPDEFLRQWEALLVQFEQIMQVPPSSKTPEFGQDPLSKSTFEQFVRAIGDLQKNMRDGGGVGSTEFNAEQMQRTWSEFLNSGMQIPAPAAGDRTGVANARAFEGAINMNGRTLRFTSPEAFRQARQRFSR